MNQVAELQATRRYINGVLLYLAIDAEHMSVLHFMQLLEYFADNPKEYLKFTNE